MYCKHCGKQLGDDTKFCPGCGSKIVFLEDVTPVSASPVIQPTQYAQQLPHVQKWSPGTLEVIGIILVIVVAFLLILASVTYYNGGDSGGSIFDPDTDGDGIKDINDAFPNDPSEWIDTDRDGVGDNSDAFPTEPSEWKDSDGDNIGNNADPDDDNDGILDVEDLFPYQNAIIKFTFSKFTLLDPVDSSWDGDPKYGQIWFELHIKNFDHVEIPGGNEYYKCEINIDFYLGQTFTFDVPDDTAEWSIEIAVYDWDSLSDSDQVDISSNGDKIDITYNLQSETWSGDTTTGTGTGSDGKLIFDIETI